MKIIPVLAALIFDDDGRILLAQRKSAIANGGKWEFPGGKLRAGEPLEVGLVREIREETGATITDLHLYDTVNVAMGKVSILLITYRCRLASPFLNLHDHAQIRWVSPREIIAYDLTPADILIAKKLCAEKAEE